MNDAKIGFELRKIQVPVDNILPVRQIKQPLNTVCRYKAIVVTVRKVGLIEPLSSTLLRFQPLFLLAPGMAFRRRLALSMPPDQI